MTAYIITDAKTAIPAKVVIIITNWFKFNSVWRTSIPLLTF